MMKITVIEDNIADIYPYFGKHEDGTIVLFLGKKEGVLITSSQYPNEKPYLSSTWEENTFKPWCGTLEVSP